MRRLLAGLALGGVLVGGARALRRRYGTTSLASTVHSALAEATELTVAVREGMAEREGQLRAALGLDVAPGTAPLGRRASRALLEDPAGARTADGSGSA